MAVQRVVLTLGLVRKCGILVPRALQQRDLPFQPIPCSQVGEGRHRRLSASKQGVWASVSTQADGQRGTDKWA